MDALTIEVGSATPADILEASLELAEIAGQLTARGVSAAVHALVRSTSAALGTALLVRPEGSEDAPAVVLGYSLEDAPVEELRALRRLLNELAEAVGSDGTPSGELRSDLRLLPVTAIEAELSRRAGAALA